MDYKLKLFYLQKTVFKMVMIDKYFLESQLPNHTQAMLFLPLQ